MAKHISKETLKTDGFLTAGDRALQFLEDHWPVVLGVALVIVVAGASWVGYDQYNIYREEKAQEEVFAWMSQLDKKQDEWTQRKQESSMPQLNDEKGKSADVAPFKANYEADFSSLVTGLEDEIKENKKTVAAQSAAMKLADFLVEHEKIEQAAGLLQEVDASVDSGSWIYGLFKVQFAALLSQTGKVDEALSQLTKVTQAKSAKFLHPEVYLKMAMLQEELGQTDKAKDLYTRVSADYGDTEAGKSAQSLNRLLDIRANVSGVAPAAVPEAKPATEEGATL